MLRAAADFRIRRHFEKGRNRSAPLRAMTRPTLVLFTDWDETITARDTLSLIAPPDSPDGDRPPFSFFVDYYLNVMAAHEKAFGPRHTLEKQLEYLGSLGVVEKASVSKVEEYGLFKGVREVDICERTKQVQFRDGWKEFAAQVTKTDHVQFMAVLSVNWSKVFIDCALRRIHDSAFMEKFEIRANDVEMDSQGVGTGKITKGDDGGIRTGPDKLREMKQLLENAMERITVYVGDSNTDLPCLLYADIGIIIGDGKSLIETCNRVGISVRDGISLKDIARAFGKGKELVLYHYNDWFGVIESGLLK